MDDRQKNLTTEIRSNGGKNKYFSVPPFLRGLLAFMAAIVSVGCAPPDSLLLVTPTPWATLAPNATSGLMEEPPAAATASPSATVPLPSETPMVQNGVYVVQQD